MKAFHFVLLLSALTGATGLFLRRYIYVNKTLPWSAAHTYCRKNFVDLLTIETNTELESFINGAPEPQYWIGIRREPGEESYTQWSDGRTIGLTNWNASQPQYNESECCVMALQGVWSEYNCQTNQKFCCYAWEPQVIVVQEMKTWLQALEHCRTFYTDLISLSSDIDLFVIHDRNLNIQTPRFWTGLRFQDGSWFWVNKEPVGNLDSLHSCPVRPFYCGARKTEGGTLEQRDCEEKMNFICYNKTVTVTSETTTEAKRAVEQA